MREYEREGMVDSILRNGNKMSVGHPLVLWQVYHLCAERLGDGGGESCDRKCNSALCGIFRDIT